MQGMSGPAERLTAWVTARLRVSTGLMVLVGFAVTPRLVAPPAPGGVSLTFQNPLGVKSLDPSCPRSSSDH